MGFSDRNPKWPLQQEAAVRLLFFSKGFSDRNPKWPLQPILGRSRTVFNVGFSDRNPKWPLQLVNLFSQLLKSIVSVIEIRSGHFNFIAPFRIDVILPFQ